MNATHVGIDFGTTNSSIAVIDPLTNKIEVKPVDVGENPHMIRTLISKGLDGEWIIGNQAAALDRLRDRSVFSLKTELRRNPSFTLTVDGETYNVTTLAAIFLRELLKKAGITRPSRLERLCLSVPVNSHENVKSILEQAALEIGVARNAIWFLDEPVSVLWDCKTVPGQYMMVFDFGGGTLDLAIMDKYETEDEAPTAQNDGLSDPETSGETERHYRGKVLAKVGLELGGDDLDDVIIRYFVEQGKEQGNQVCDSLSLDIFDDPERLQRLKHHPKFTFYYQLKAAAEKTKHMLSEYDRYSLSIPPLIPGADEGIKGIVMTLEQFMHRTEGIRTRMLQGLKQVNDLFAKQTGKSRQQIDAVLLSGGSSLLSFVPDLLEELYPNARIVWDEEHLQTRIARGNAVYTRSEEEMAVGDVVNASFGIYNHAGNETIVMIEPTDAYPVHKTRRIATTKANQKEIEIVPMMKQAHPKAKFERLKRNGVPLTWRMNVRPHPMAKDFSRITLSYVIDKSQKLTIRAYDNWFKEEVGIEEIALPELGF